ncbi:MAG: hypothetical protein GY694_15795 [Gammaproteobacteria bacterium]|nr:hypothetical protein [Gammaproteobacteria bacterium]
MPYALGRPLGSADDPEFQKNVIRASLAMFETATERTIEDYPVEAPDEVARALGSIADRGGVDRVPEGPVEWAFDLPLLIRYLADDLRTFYHEAIAAQPGPGAPNHDALNDWIFGGTALGATLQKVAARLTQADSPMAKLVRGFLIPEGHYQGGSAFPATAEFGAQDGQ